MLVRIMALVSIFALELCFASGNHKVEVLPYKATYSAKYNGLPITAVKTLVKTSESQFSEQLKASGLLITLSESSNYRVSNNGQLIPLDHQIDRSIMGIRRSELQVFDWKDKNAHYRRGEKTSNAPASTSGADTEARWGDVDSPLGRHGVQFPENALRRPQGRLIHPTYPSGAQNKFQGYG